MLISAHPMSMEPSMQPSRQPNPGDTIFVIGSGNQLWKHLHFRHAFHFWHRPQSRSRHWPEELNLVRFTFTPFSDGSVLSGFKTGNITVESGGDDIEISNCWLDALFLDGGSGYLIESNYLDRHYCSPGCNYTSTFGNNNVTNSVFRNNVFQTKITGFDESSVLFDQNLFLNWNGGNGGFLTNSFIRLENNIFFGADDSLGCTNCIYPQVIVGADTTNGNLDFYHVGGSPVGQDPLIEGLSLGTNNYMNPGLYSYHSLTLEPGSPAIGAGTGGQDLGVLGGLAPFTYHGHPLLPRITSWTSPGQIIQAGGTINVTIEAKAAE